jgi:DNA-binding CsgD family transcriptional regulator
MGDHGDAGRSALCTCGAAHLTSRKVQVLLLAAAGLSGRAIGHQLGISPRTVEDHLTVMRKHAGASDTTELVARCYAAEVLIPAWPPRWSGRSCLLIPQRPRCQPAGGSPDARLAGTASDDARTRGMVTRKQALLRPAGSAPARPATEDTGCLRESGEAGPWNRSFPGPPQPAAARPGKTRPKN